MFLLLLKPGQVRINGTRPQPWGWWFQSHLINITKDLYGCHRLENSKPFRSSMLEWGWRTNIYFLLSIIISQTNFCTLSSIADSLCFKLVRKIRKCDCRVFIIYSILYFYITETVYMYTICMCVCVSIHIFFFVIETTESKPTLDSICLAGKKYAEYTLILKWRFTRGGY